MATLSITPAVDSWAYQTDAFSIVFKAYDDNGECCRNNQLSIQYIIAYDGSMPDPTQMQRVYSDASGVIPLLITKPCVISIYGIYAHDVNDPSKGEVIQELAMNYEITFQPIIKTVQASYMGPDVEISDKFNASNLSIKIEMTDGSVKTISHNDCVITDYQITETGPNIKYATYTDPLLGTVWELPFTINGIPKLLALDAYYCGERKIIGDKIFTEEVKVTGMFLTSIDTSEQVELSSDKWFFVDIPIITDDNKGFFIIGYKAQRTVISVPYDTTTSLRLNVWYEGDKIEVGHTYNPNNVIVYLVYPDGQRYRTSLNNCQIDSYLVTTEGWNWFTVTYMNQLEQITQEFAVEGIIYKEYIDLDFKVLYITDKTKEQGEDVTEDFEHEFKFDDVLLVDWNNFLTVVNRIQKYGLYIVTVPKLSGLSNRFDMDWEVLCINKTTIKATVKKIYNEEEEDNGKEINH